MVTFSGNDARPVKYKWYVFLITTRSYDLSIMWVKNLLV